MEDKKADVKGNASGANASGAQASGSKASNAKTVQKHKSLLASYLDQKVLLVTFDGRTLVGTMRGCDQVCNVILEKTIERVFAAGEKPKEVNLGLFVVRGDNVAVVGEVDPERDSPPNWDSVKVPPLQPFVH